VRKTQAGHRPQAALRLPAVTAAANSCTLHPNLLHPWPHESAKFAPKIYIICGPHSSVKSAFKLVPSVGLQFSENYAHNAFIFRNL
jgi:hypothetical protein